MQGQQGQGVDSLLGRPHSSSSEGRNQARKENLIIEGEVIRDDEPEKK